MKNAKLYRDISVGKGEGSKPGGQWSSRHRHQHSRIGTGKGGSRAEGANYARREAYRPALVRPCSQHLHHKLAQSASFKVRTEEVTISLKLPKLSIHSLW
jgi:hypothetical protein